jgi:hypothetical protein
MEIWRELGGRYRLNGLETWYPTHDGAQAIYADALQYLAKIKARENDVFAIQFG